MQQEFLPACPVAFPYYHAATFHVTLVTRIGGRAGAALLGAEPGLVRARRCRLTYGIRCRALWTSEEAVSYSAFGYPQRIWKPEDNEYFAGAWRVGA